MTKNIVLKFAIWWSVVQVGCLQHMLIKFEFCKVYKVSTLCGLVQLNCVQR